MDIDLRTAAGRQHAGATEAVEEVGDQLGREGEGVVGHVRETDDEVHDLLDLRVEVGDGHAAGGVPCLNEPFDIALRVADAAEFDVGGDFQFLAGQFKRREGALLADKIQPRVRFGRLQKMLQRIHREFGHGGFHGGKLDAGRLLRRLGLLRAAVENGIEPFGRFLCDDQ